MVSYWIFTIFVFNRGKYLQINFWPFYEWNTSEARSAIELNCNGSTHRINESWWGIGKPNPTVKQTGVFEKHSNNLVDPSKASCRQQFLMYLCPKFRIGEHDLIALMVKVEITLLSLVDKFSSTAAELSQHPFRREIVLKMICGKTASAVTGISSRLNSHLCSRTKNARV